MSRKPEERRNQETADYYLLKSQSGDLGSAFFGLIDCEHAVLPQLQDAYRSEKDWSVRDLLVEAVWQHRQQSSVPFLFEALQDGHEAVWMQALDGLVALASAATRDGLANAIRLEPDPKRREWFQEAVDQINLAISVASDEMAD
jgi:hypothetical protein